jgi:hypothetical protein
MNEQAIIDAYNLFVQNGYNKSLDDYKKLIASNSQAVQDSYDLFVGNGYSKSIDDFKSLMGLSVPSKKKDDTVSALAPSLLASPSTKAVAESTAVKPVIVGQSPKKEEGDSYLKNIYNNLALGASYVNEAVVSVPETLINLFAIPQNFIAEKTGWNIGTNADQVKKQLGIKNPLLDYIQESQKVIKGDVSKYIAQNYDDPSIVGNFQKGNYQEAFELLGSSIAQSAPLSATMMMAGAYMAPARLAAITTVGLTESQRKELEEMDPEMKESEKTLKALGMSAAESVFESLGSATIGRAYRDIAKREGKEAAKDILKNGLVQTYKKALEKTGAAAGFAGEGIEEAATQITQNVIAGKPTFEGVADAFVTGAGSGVIFTAPISAAQAKNYINNKVKTYQAKDKIGEVLGEKADNINNLYNVPANSDITAEQLEVANVDNARLVLQKKLKDAVDKGTITEDDAKQSLYVFDKTQQVSNSVKDLDVSVEDKAKIATLLKKRDELATKIQNKDDVLVVLEKQQIQEINNQIQSIITKPKEDAVQKQAAGEVPVQPTTGISEEVAQGEPQSKPEVVTEEGVTPEVTEEKVVSLKTQPEITRESVAAFTDEQLAPVMNLIPKTEGIPVQDAVYDAYVASKKEGTNPELVNQVENLVYESIQDKGVQRLGEPVLPTPTEIKLPTAQQERVQPSPKREEIKQSLDRVKNAGVLVSAQTGKEGITQEEIDVQMALTDAMANVWKETTGNDDFYDTFIEDIKVGDIDAIKEKGGALFQNVEQSQRPLSRVSLAIFELPEFQKMKGSTVAVQSVTDMIKSRGKQIEKDIINTVLGYDKYKGQKKISFDEFRDDVETQVMKLEKINTNTYATYGKGNLGNKEDYGTAETIIFNSPIDHGQYGHFRNDFTKQGLQQKTWNIKQLPGTEQYVAIDADMPSDVTQAEVSQYIGTAGPKADVERWIADRNNIKNDAEINKGLFGHIRGWFNKEKGIYNLAELQSDYFQKNKANDLYASKITEDEINEYLNKNFTVALDKKYVDIMKNDFDLETKIFNDANGNRIVQVFKKSDPENIIEQMSYAPSYIPRIGYTVDEIGEYLTVVLAARKVDSARTIAKAMEEGEQALGDSRYNQLRDLYNKEEYNIQKEERQKYIAKRVEEIKKSDEGNLMLKQFAASQKVHELRLFREAIKHAAESGATELRFPAPFTIATIEGYISESGRAPYEIIEGNESRLDHGDTIDYGGVEMMVVDSSAFSITVAPKDEVIIYNIPDLVDDEANIRMDEIDYDIKKQFDDVDNITREDAENYKEDEWMAGYVTFHLDNYFKNNPEAESVSWARIYDIVENDVRTEFEQMDISDLISWSADMYVHDDTVYALERRNAERLGQPDEYDSDVDEDNFRQDLDDDQETVVSKYESLGDTIKKMRTDAQIVTDANGKSWLSTKITDADRMNPVIAFQQEGGKIKGAIDFSNDNKASIYIFKGADISTLAHEATGHLGRRMLEQLAQRDPMFARDYEAAKTWSGVKDDQWSVAAEEKFARGFERYLRNGKAPNQSLKSVFEKLRTWLTNIYKFIKDSSIDVELTPEITRVFDNLLGGKEPRRAPSAQKILGQKKTKVTVDEMAALKDQIRLEARAAREAKGDLNKKRKQLIDVVRKMGTDGKMDVKKVNALINRIGKLNLDSQIAVDKFVDYAEKVFADAEYANKLGAATIMRRQIRKLSKNKDKAANLRDLGSQFVEIDPSMVEDIDAYNQMASMLSESIKGSSIRGKDVKFADIVRQDELVPYINREMDAQRQKLFDMKVAEIQELLGVDASELNYEQLVELLAKDKEMPKDNEKLVRSAINKAFDIYSTMIKESIKTGKDLFTGEEVSYTPSQKKVVGEFMNMKLDELSPKEALEAVDGLMNFIQNGSTAKMESVVRSYTGRVNAKELANKGIKASPLRKYWSKPLGRFLGEQTTNLNILFEKMFKGFERGGMVEDKSGVTDLKNGKSAGQAEANAIVNDYVKKFYEKKANGEAFNTDFNNVERGMTAFMMRNVIGSEAEMKAEFDRRKNLVNESIAELEKGNEQEVEKSKVYQEVYDKILKDATNMDEVSANVDKTNMDAVNFWQAQWANKYEELADVSLNVYNKILGKDINYNPDKFTNLSTETGTVEIATDDMAFHVNNGTIYKKETGVLMEATRPESLPKNPKNGETSMYIDLSFDKNNANAMYDALVDIKTAGPIRQVESFLNSASLKKVVPQAEDAEILKDRISLFVNNIRNKNPYSNDELSRAVRRLNKIAAIGVGQSLGGVLQPVKQVIPVAMNTLINGGGLDIGAVTNPAKNKFISNSGYAIANRGVESQAQIESIDKLIDKAAKSKGEKSLQYIEEANRKWLEIFLVKPDVFIARSSWMTYYEQSLEKQGINPKTIDYNTHEINKKAADYAQRMVDRQQNISDADLAGKLFAGKEPTKQVMIKMLMPFASFRMNQSARLGADLGTLMSNVSTVEDKKIAARSLAGFGVEMATFRMISVGSALLIAALVKQVMGREDDEEKDKKKMDAIVKGQLTSTVADMFSPLPLTDKIVQAGAAGALEKVQNALEVADEDRLSIYSGNKQDLVQSLGLFGITADRALQLYDIANLSSGGSFKDDYGREKYLSESDREALALLIAPALLTNIGLAPSEVNSVIRSSVNDAKRNATTNESGVKKEKGAGKKMSKEDMKKYYPDMYNEMYGPGGTLYEVEQMKKEIRKEKQSLKQ